PAFHSAAVDEVLAGPGPVGPGPVGPGPDGPVGAGGVGELGRGSLSGGGASGAGQAATGARGISPGPPGRGPNSPPQLASRGGGPAAQSARRVRLAGRRRWAVAGPGLIPCTGARGPASKAGPPGCRGSAGCAVRGCPTCWAWSRPGSAAAGPPSARRA